MNISRITMYNIEIIRLRTQNPSMKQTQHHSDEVPNRAPGKHSKFARGSGEGTRRRPEPR